MNASDGILGDWLQCLGSLRLSALFSLERFAAVRGGVENQGEYRGESMKLTRNGNGSLKAMPSDLANLNTSLKPGHIYAHRINSVLETCPPKHEKVTYTKILVTKTVKCKNAKELGKVVALRKKQKQKLKNNVLVCLHLQEMSPEGYFFFFFF